MAKRPTGKAMRDAREGLGLSQSDVAHRLGITPAAVGHYEKGLAKPPLPRAEQLAKLLKISITQIPVSNRPSAAAAMERAEASA